MSPSAQVPKPTDGIGVYPVAVFKRMDFRRDTSQTASALGTVPMNTTKAERDRVTAESRLIVATSEKMYLSAAAGHCADSMPSGVLREQALGKPSQSALMP